MRANLGDVKIRNLDRARLIQFGRDRAKQGAGAVTLGIDFTFIRTLMVDAAAIHGITLSTEPVLLARTALKRLGLIGKGQERDRRPGAEAAAKPVAAKPAMTQTMENYRSSPPCCRAQRAARLKNLLRTQHSTFTRDVDQASL